MKMVVVSETGFLDARILDIRSAALTGSKNTTKYKKGIRMWLKYAKTIYDTKK